MFEKLKDVEARYEEINAKLSDPEVMANREEWQRLIKEHAGLEEIVNAYRTYGKLQNTVAEAKALLQEKIDDDDFRDLVKTELAEAEEKLNDVERRIKMLLLPKDPNDEKNVIIEIRGGAGGEEAALFASVLFRMYSRYAERMRWSTEIMSSNPTGLGGFKEVIFTIEGKGAYSRLKYESGVHRVQRVPETEASGRIHTSTVTVAVLPEVEEVEVNINPVDLRIDTFRAGGPGGQHVNKTESAIRITHIPTGIVVSCQDEKSQHKNKDKAMRILRAKLFEAEVEKQEADLARERKSQIGTGDRSERIRTYNFPQGRVTDHRIGLTLYKIESILDGDLDEVIDALITADRSEQLKRGMEQY